MCACAVACLDDRRDNDPAWLNLCGRAKRNPFRVMHRLVMSEVEAPLLEAVMRYTGNNQSKASIMLGLNRGTLRTKLKHYGML